jgi:hypothetical protein
VDEYNYYLYEKKNYKIRDNIVAISDIICLQPKVRNEPDPDKDKLLLELLTL